MIQLPLSRRSNHRRRALLLSLRLRQNLVGGRGVLGNITPSGPPALLHKCKPLPRRGVATFTNFVYFLDLILLDNIN